MACWKFQIVTVPYCWDWGQVEQGIEDRVVHPLVQNYLGGASKATDTMDKMVDYEKTGSLDTDFSIPETKELVGLDVVPMNSKGSDISLQVVKVGATMYQDMKIMEENDY